MLHIADRARDLLQKRAVVRHDEERTAQAAEIIPEPRDVRLVEKICRLVEQQDVRLLQQEFGQDHLCALPAAHRADRARKAERRQPEPRRDLLDFRVDPVKIPLLEHRLQRRGLFQARRIPRAPRIEPEHFVLGRVKLREGRAQKIAHRHRRLRGGLLIEIADAHLRLPDDAARIRHELPRADADQRALARAVRADDADVLAPVQRKVGVLKQDVVAERMAQSRDFQ